MRRELVIKSRSLAGASDLTLLAPIKKGLVPSLESVTYKTRIKRLLQALNTGRGSAQEFALLRPFADAVERVGRIHSVRVTVLEPEDKVLLAVSFEGTWEAYIRVLWQKVGPLLDIIFFDTEDYVSAYDSRFEEWEAWARRVQVETDFFYSTPNLTVDDVQYLRRTESLQRNCPARPDADLAATRLTVDSAEAIAWRAAAKTSGQASLEAVKQGLEALAALYRLTDLYLPTGDDGQFLQRAVRDLLREFIVLIEKDEVPPDVLQLARMRFDKQIEWVRQPLVRPKNPQRVAPPLPATYPDVDKADVQGGIVNAYTGVTHGCLMLLAITDRARAVAFFSRLVGAIRYEDAGAALDGSAPAVAVNASLTYEGLRAVGLGEDELALFPQEFREGMEARASILGDQRTNHPRRWSLPARFSATGAEPARVELSTVHLVVQLRTGAAKSDAWRGDPGAADHPLAAAFAEWRQAAIDGGLALLAVEPLQRFYKGTTGEQVEEHFGFADGDSDPTIDPSSAGKVYPNQIHLGELLVGQANEADWPSDPEQRSDPALERRRLAWLRNGSFLVVRKLAQDRSRLDRIVEAAADQTGLDAETVRAKMMGRKSDGTALVPLTAAARSPNDFDYSGDPAGSACPFHGHIRRANPRNQTLEVNEAPGRRTPRIARRGMSYGPRFQPDDPASAKAPRGMVFMAYNARIGEQFEVIQRWISGGNSSRAYSGQSDPFLGVPENGRRRTYRFEYDSGAGPAVACIALDGSDDPLAERAPIVRLEWGAYLFTPSRTALARLRDRVGLHAASPEVPWSAADGERRIQELIGPGAGTTDDERIQAVKTALEDPVEQEKFRSASLWAAIRERHAGVLRTPYGVLVADRNLIDRVLADGATYSVRGYHDRLSETIGDIYLGHDAGPEYDQLSTATNQAIQAIGKGDAFELTRAITSRVLDTFLLVAQQLPNPCEPARWELMLEIKEVVDQVLGRLCQYWFGLPKDDTDELRLSGHRWDAGTVQALYPGHFTAPSRHAFQPQPGVSVQDLGREHGRTLTSAFTRFVGRTVAEGGWPLKDPAGHEAPVVRAIWTAFGSPPQVDLIARTMVGAMMGMLPTVDGSLRRALNEWLYEGRFWSLRTAWTSIPVGGRDFTAAVHELEPALRAAMQLRPSPELIWRTATRAAVIGTEAVQAGDRIVLALVSATQAELAAGGPDVYPIFGGNRRAPSPPTHACPGYDAAIGVLLGFVAALLEVPESMRAAPVPLALTFAGPFGKASDADMLQRFGQVLLDFKAAEDAQKAQQERLAADRRQQLARLLGSARTTGGQ